MQLQAKVEWPQNTEFFVSKVYRFMEYRRAIWFSADRNLETCLREALVTAPNSTERIVTKADNSSIMANEVFDAAANGIFFANVKVYRWTAGGRSTNDRECDR